MTMTKTRTETDTFGPIEVDASKYWGAQAGPAGKGYYSYELGAWHVVVLNTNCEAAELGGCGLPSTSGDAITQTRWTA